MQSRAIKTAPLWALWITLLVVLAGCGGGGGTPGPGNVATTVVGTVKDSARGDAPVVGATVVIGGQSATTGADGTFTIQNAQVGANTAIITVPGGQPQTVAFSPPIAAGQNGPFNDLFINIGQVTGRVLGPNGQPAAGAFVTVLTTGIGSDSVPTGSDGRFTIDAVPTGPTEVTAVLGTAFASKPITVVPGVTDIGDLPLVDDPNPTPPGVPVTIQGTITLSDGTSAAGLSVVLTRNNVQYEIAVTDANGYYSFYVPVGDYGLRVVKPGYRDATGAVSVIDPSVAARADLALFKL